MEPLISERIGIELEVLGYLHRAIPPDTPDSHDSTMRRN